MSRSAAAFFWQNLTSQTFTLLDDLAKIFTGSPTTEPVEVTTTATPEESEATDSLTTPATPAEGEPSSSSATLDMSIAQLSLEAEGTAVAAEEAALASASFSTPEYYFPKDGQQSDWHGPHPLFDLEQLGIDRRLVRSPAKFSVSEHDLTGHLTTSQLVNRKKQLKMYRCWMQVRARKLLEHTGDESVSRQPAGYTRPVMLEERLKKD